MDLLLSILNVASSEDETTPPTSPDQIMRPSPVPSARTPDLKAAHRPKEDVPSRTATLMHDYKSSTPKPVLKTKPDQRKSTTNRRVHFADFLAYRQDADIELQCERKQREAEVSMQRDRTDKLILRAKRQSLRAMQCAL